MKKNALIIALLAAAGFMSTSAQAADGTITFTGEIQDVTCPITGAANFAVDLLPVQPSSLGADGKVAGAKPFSIKVGDGGSPTTCPTNTKVAIVFDTTSPKISPAGNLKNTVSDDHAEHVEVQILDAAAGNAPIDLRNGDKTTEVLVAGGAAEMKFMAQYIAVGAPATAGLVDTSVGYTVTFP